MSQFVFKMPDLGEGTVEAEIVAWHTKPGDAVQEDEVIVEVMTDKAAVEVPAPVTGRVVSITGEPGDKVAVGSPLIVFETAAAGVSTGEPARPPAADRDALGSTGSGKSASGGSVAAGASPTAGRGAAISDAAARQVGPGASGGASSTISVAPPTDAAAGTSAGASNIGATLPTSLGAEASGSASGARRTSDAAARQVGSGASVAASSKIGVAPPARAGAGADATATVAAAAGFASRVAASAETGVNVPTGVDGAGALAAHSGRIKASPASRRRAREAGIDLATVVGTGPGGRIVSGDLAAVSGDARPSPSVAGVAPVEQPRPAGVDGRSAAARPAADETTEIKVIGVRRLIAERMSEAKRNIPHFAYVEEVDVTELEALRVHLNAKLAKGEPTLTYLPLVVLALTRVLESFPQCNVLYDAARGVLVRHSSVHVGVATQTPDGLKVPVVRNVQSRSLWDLAAEIRRVSERARMNTATRDELVGSTITVTSLGKLGGIASTPVINSPEVAIIGLNKALERPVVHHGAVVVRRIMNLSSSFDHRFVDGYDAAAMIQALKDSLEHPATIFIPKVKTP